LAREVGAIGGGLPAVFNAANEVAVQAFVDGALKFTEIVKTVSSVVDSLRASVSITLRDLSDVSAVEEDARRTAHEFLKKVG
jgi:1-deoxy-D-xylulose-5-phosphate reductoisomerase